MTHPPRIMDIKTKINKWGLIKLKNVCTDNETMNNVKRQPSECEKVIVNETTYNGLISKIYMQLRQKKYQKNSPFKKWGKDLNRHFSQEDISSVQFSCSVLSDSFWAYEPQHARPPCPSSTPGPYPNSCPLSQCYHLSSPSPLALNPSQHQGLFKCQFFTSGGQGIGVSASTSVLPMNTQDWSPLGWTGWISLQSKGLSRVFSNTIVQKQQFFSAQLSLLSNSHIHTRLLEKP